MQVNEESLDMESNTHFINGYDKVSNPIDSPLSHHPHKPAATYHRQTTAISLLILITLLIAAVSYVSTPNKPSSTELTQPKPDPTLLFNTSLYISLAELKNISSLPQTLITESTDTRTVSALQDCEILFDDAVSQINKSINSLEVGAAGDVVVFTRAKIRDLNVWISGAMSDQETCLDGLEEMGSTVCDEVRMKMQLSKQCLSDSLAILAKIQPVQKLISRYL